MDGQIKNDTKRKADNYNQAKNRNLKKSKIYTRPTHFFAIQISNPKIHKVLKDVQSKIVSHEETFALKKIITPCTEFHITLCLAAFEQGEFIQRVIAGVKQRSPEMRAIFDGGFKLHVEKLNTFNNQVLFASIRQDDVYPKLLKLNLILKQIVIAEANENSLTDSNFHPHITLMKISKFRKDLKFNGCYKINKKLYEEFSNSYFGEQAIYNLQLLKIGDRNEFGYYKKIYQLNFVCDIRESFDHTECCQQYYNKERNKREFQKTKNLPSTSQEDNKQRNDLSSENKTNTIEQVKPIRKRKERTIFIKNGLYTLLNFLSMSLATYIISRKISQIL